MNARQAQSIRILRIFRDFAENFAHLAGISSTDSALGDTNTCSILPAERVLLDMTLPTFHTVAAVPAGGLTTRS